MKDLSKPLKEIRIPVTEHDHGKRIDAFLAEVVNWMSREKLKDRINEGTITLNHDKVLPRRRLKNGENIYITVENPMENFVDPATIPMPVVFENEHILAVNKMPGIMVHPAGRTVYGTLINAVHYYFKQKDEDAEPRLLHRIDKNTSGLVLISKNAEAHKEVSRAFAERHVAKTYHAICHGSLPHPKGIIAAPIGDCQGSHIRIKMGVDYDNGKESLTRYEVIKNTERYSLVKAVPETGRQHQIRLHLAHIGCHIVGDTMYGASAGSKKELEWDKDKRFYLHAYSLEITRCKLLGGALTLCAPYPDDFQQFLDENF